MKKRETSQPKAKALRRKSPPKVRYLTTAFLSGFYILLVVHLPLPVPPAAPASIPFSFHEATPHARHIYKSALVAPFSARTKN